MIPQQAFFVTPTFLALPQEMRNEIYTYLLPHHPWNEEKRKGWVEFKVSKEKDHMDRSRFRGPNPDDLRALQKTCRQLYREVRPTWFRYNSVCLVEYSLGFPETMEWFKRFPVMDLPLVSRMEIMVESSEQTVGSQTIWRNVLAWKHFEDEVMPKTTLARINARGDINEMQWIHCSSLVSKLRDAKMSWVEIDSCIENVDGIVRWNNPVRSSPSG